jgi:hypothetical protein
MGIDIRIYPEQQVNGRWQFIGEMIENMYDTEEQKRPYHPEGLYESTFLTEETGSLESKQEQKSFLSSPNER